MGLKNGNLPDADDVIKSVGNTTAQLSYEQVKSDSSSWTNTDYLGADIFSDSNGAKNTIDTGTTTALYDSVSDFYALKFTDEASGDTTHDDDSFTDPENAFDSNDATFATEATVGNTYNKSLGKTFASKHVGWVRIKADMAIAGGDTHACNIAIESLDGTWSSAGTLATGVSSCSFDGRFFLDATKAGVRVKFNMTGNNNPTTTAKLYTLEYGDYDASSIVETNSIISDKIPDSIVIYGKATIPANTSITVDISEDGGAGFGITGESLNSAIDTSSFSAGNLAIKFNLATTDDEATPLLYGYGIAITDV